MSKSIVETEESVNSDELEQELENVYEELEETTESLHATEDELARMKARVEQLEDEREVEGWDEWAKVMAKYITKEEVTKLQAQAHVTEDALVAVYRKGLLTGITYITDLVNKHIEEGMKVYEEDQE